MKQDRNEYAQGDQQRHVFHRIILSREGPAVIESCRTYARPVGPRLGLAVRGRDFGVAS